MLISCYICGTFFGVINKSVGDVYLFVCVLRSLNSEVI